MPLLRDSGLIEAGPSHLFERGEGSKSRGLPVPSLSSQRKRLETNHDDPKPSLAATAKRKRGFLEGARTPTFRLIEPLGRALPPAALLPHDQPIGGGIRAPPVATCSATGPKPLDATAFIGGCLGGRGRRLAKAPFLRGPPTGWDEREPEMDTSSAPSEGSLRSPDFPPVGLGEITKGVAPRNGTQVRPELQKSQCPRPRGGAWIRLHSSGKRGPTEKL
jgi:hypothetical protein